MSKLSGKFAKATQDTKFHIDYDWWENDASLRLYLLSHIQNKEERKRLSNSVEGAVVDYVHPETGEVFKYDELNLALQKSAQQDDFINPQASTVDNIFRVFLKNGNQPMTPRELELAVGRPSSTILKTIGGTRVYKGLRPVSDS